MKTNVKNAIRKIDIPPGIIKGYSMEIYSGTEAVLSGNIDIEQLSETVLKIKINEHRICFSGKNIRISCYTYDGIKIKGELEHIDFG